MKGSVMPEEECRDQVGKDWRKETQLSLTSAVSTVVKRYVSRLSVYVMGRDISAIKLIFLQCVFICVLLIVHLCFTMICVAYLQIS